MEKVKKADNELDQVTGGTTIPYTVQPGDTLNAIAQKFSVSTEQLIRWNNIQDPNMLQIGTALQIKF